MKASYKDKEEEFIELDTDPEDKKKPKKSFANKCLFYLFIIVISAFLMMLGALIERYFGESLHHINTDLPLVDLHLHLDGAITPEIARKLAEIQGIDTLPKSYEELKKQIVFEFDPNTKPSEGLNEYLKKFDLPLSLLQTRIGIIEAIKLVAKNIKSQGIKYAELKFAPMLHCQKGMTQEEAVQAALEGIKQADLHVNLILCMFRGDESLNEANELTINLTAKYLVKDKGVVALDLAGAEALYKTENFEHLFIMSRLKNIPCIIHAGEADDHTSIDSALKFGAQRIGHGVHAFESMETMQNLARYQVFVEMSPTSNIHTHSIEDFSKYPIKQYLKMGIRAFVNTDDPAISDTTVQKEFKLLEEKLGLTKEEKKQLLKNAIFAAFTSYETKEKLLKYLE